jgi:hypothetical protein
LQPIREFPDAATDPLFIAVEVDLLIQRGEVDVARQLVEEVLQDREMSRWLRDYFQQLRDELQAVP